VALLSAYPSLKFCFDHSPSSVHCHHAKVFLVDDTCYVGGLTLSYSHLLKLLERSGKKITCAGNEISCAGDEIPRAGTEISCAGTEISWFYDSFTEVRGTPADDVAALFAVRWNGIPRGEGGEEGGKEGGEGRHFPKFSEIDVTRDVYGE
jgi:hypothetical protein